MSGGDPVCYLQSASHQFDASPTEFCAFVSFQPAVGSTHLIGLYRIVSEHRKLGARLHYLTVGTSGLPFSRLMEILNLHLGNIRNNKFRSQLFLFVFLEFTRDSLWIIKGNGRAGGIERVAHCLCNYIV